MKEKDYNIISIELIDKERLRLPTPTQSYELLSAIVIRNKKILGRKFSIAYKDGNWYDITINESDNMVRNYQGANKKFWNKVNKAIKKFKEENHI